MLTACTTCGSKIRVPDNAVGKKGKCPKCGNVMVITPAPEEPEPSAEAPPPVPPPVPPPPRGKLITLLYSSNLGGDYEQCGCPVHPLGGVARRATVIDRAARERLASAR